jgi:ABC-type branched-subunit amino acid transport system substrate-binding protein
MQALQAKPRITASGNWILAAFLLTLSACSTAGPVTPPAPKLAAAPPKPAAPVPSKPAPPVQTAAATLASAHVKVALLLPLSGETAALGQGMLDAANLAVFDIADKNFELMPEDTGDTPGKAKEAADHAETSGAQLILGPVFSPSVAAVKPIAQRMSLNVVSFSTDTTQAGDNVFVMGFLPAAEIERVADYAKAEGASHFAALAPEGAYGNSAIGALQEIVPDAAPLIRYAPGGDPAARVPALTAAGVPFDALLLPEGGDKLRAIAKALPGSGIDVHKVHLLGSGLWDEPALGQEPELVGGWYAGTPASARADFEKRFEATYHYKPPRLATLAYDATALAIVLARQTQAGQAPFDKAALTKASGFAGIDGIFRFHDNGQIERGLAILQVTPTGETVIDPAPRTFQKQAM